MRMVESRSDARTVTGDFILQQSTVKEKFNCAVGIINLGADFHDKIAAVIIEAWERLLKVEG